MGNNTTPSEQVVYESGSITTLNTSQGTRTKAGKSDPSFSSSSSTTTTTSSRISDPNYNSYPITSTTTTTTTTTTNISTIPNLNGSYISNTSSSSSSSSSASASASSSIFSFMDSSASSASTVSTFDILAQHKCPELFLSAIQIQSIIYHWVRIYQVKKKKFHTSVEIIRIVNVIGSYSYLLMNGGSTSYYYSPNHPNHSNHHQRVNSNGSGHHSKINFSSNGSNGNHNNNGNNNNNNNTINGHNNNNSGHNYSYSYSYSYNYNYNNNSTTTNTNNTTNNTQREKMVLNIALHGMSQSGKTSFLSRYLKGEFQDSYITTIKVYHQHTSYLYTHDTYPNVHQNPNFVNVKQNMSFDMYMYDRPTLQRFITAPTCAPYIYYHNMQIILLLYDVCNLETFEYCKSLWEEIMPLFFTPNALLANLKPTITPSKPAISTITMTPLIVMVGNKVDQLSNLGLIEDEKSMRNVPWFSGHRSSISANMAIHMNNMSLARSRNRYPSVILNASKLNLSNTNSNNSGLNNNNNNNNNNKKNNNKTTNHNNNNNNNTNNNMNNKNTKPIHTHSNSDKHFNNGNTKMLLERAKSARNLRRHSSKLSSADQDYTTTKSEKREGHRKNSSQPGINITSKSVNIYDTHTQTKNMNVNRTRHPKPKCERQVPRDMVRTFCQENNIIFGGEISCKTGERIQELMQLIVGKWLLKFPKCSKCQQILII